jgi:hypothetical protein
MTKGYSMSICLLGVIIVCTLVFFGQPETHGQQQAMPPSYEEVVKWQVSKSSMSQFTNANGVYQDSVLALFRDPKGSLWALAGHSHLGGISVWRGTTIDNLRKLYYIKYNFFLGKAGKAFNAIRYPDGPQSRGDVWPMGLWIDPQDGRFYCPVHNETISYPYQTTNYTVYGQGEAGPPFRHLGLMVSNDQGRNWDFKGWIITSHEPCWTSSYRPDGLKNGQDSNVVFLGAGDSSLFVNSQDRYMYIFYTQMSWSMKTKETLMDYIHVARASVDSKGMPGTWKKYFEGSFSEPGNMGKESAVLEDGAEPCVAYDTYLKKYIMTTYRRSYADAKRGACQVSVSSDLVHWAKPEPLALDRNDLSMPYFTIFNTNPLQPHNVIGQVFGMFAGSNGTDVRKVTVTIGR